ncbi:MAG: hypothetical protein QXW94_03220, partial [Desulfurococcaceae archaeon]
ASVDHVAEAISLGERIKRGEIASTSVDYGKLYSSALKDSFRLCNATHPQYITPLLIVGVSVGLSGVESILGESAKFKKAIETINSVSKWSDIRQFVDSLKIIDRDDMFEHLQSLGYTQIAILRSGVTFNDLYRVLSSKWRGFSIVEAREGAVFSYLKQFSDLYRDYKSLAATSVAFYMELVEPHLPQQFKERAQEAKTCKYMATPECSKLMYELDLLFRRNKLLFEWASEVVVLTSSLGSFEGLR